VRLVDIGRRGGALRAFAAGLLELPALRGILWSNDDAGTRLLGEPRDESRR
jgi:hypothetical protein